MPSMDPPRRFGVRATRASFGAQVRRGLLELSGADGEVEVCRRAGYQVSGCVLRARARAARAVLAHPARVDLSPTHHTPTRTHGRRHSSCSASRTRSTEVAKHTEVVYQHWRVRPGAARSSATSCAADEAVQRGAPVHGVALEGRGWRGEGAAGRWRAGQGLARAWRSPQVLGPGWGCGSARAADLGWSATLANNRVG